MAHVFFRVFLQYKHSQMAEDAYLGLLEITNVQNCYICGFNHDILRLTDDIMNSLV